jgi:deazaflavin-dependent oxidoreductase (nitroreductase family)
MTLHGEYEPSKADWARELVELYERTGGREGNVEPTTGLPVIIVTTRGHRSGKLRKTPLMRVEHGGRYALIGSYTGAPHHPGWYHNLKADPTALTVQDGPQPFDAVAREVTGEERRIWWERALVAFPRYADYQQGLDRQIPVFVVERRTTRPRGLESGA